MMTETERNDFSIRSATREDTALILQLIKELADYESMIDLVVATEETLEDSLFHKRNAEVIIAEYQQKPIGYALFFHNFSTFLGRSGLYIEDIYIKPEMRGKGFGSNLLIYLSALAKERNCGRLEWCCLNWNEPSIKFYQQMGAIPMSDWTIFRLQGEALDKLADH